ncbi:MAG: hypothetical protein MJ150_06725, partial [Clostridia bacterium]|nr:hypothetical protein [Clostridia bacterium]
FSFRDELGVEIFFFSFPDGKSLFVGTYKAKSIYNHYQENTFKLSKRLSGTKTITLAFTTSDRISVQGFYFKKQEKAYALLDATSCSRISGDSFSLKNDGIYSIGNNVTIDYDNMNFKNGINRVRIKGKSNNPVTSIHIMLINNDTSERTMVEIPHKDAVDWYEFPISFSPINSSVSFVFLPGSDFDFYSFEFLQ